MVRTWPDALRDALGETTDPGRARMLATRYAGAFSGAYREAFSSTNAIADIGVLERLDDDHPRVVRADLHPAMSPSHESFPFRRRNAR